MDIPSVKTGQQLYTVNTQVNTWVNLIFSTVSLTVSEKSPKVRIWGALEMLRSF